MEAIGAQIKFHTLAVHELRKVLLPAGSKGAVLLLSRRHGGQVRRVHLPAETPRARRFPVTGGAYRSRRVAQDRADRLVSCWTESDHESSLMWKAYAGAEGVAVRTTFQNLQDSIRSVAELPVTFGQVEYVDYRNEVPRFGSAPLFHKRTEYREEGEVRAVLPGPPWDHTGVPETPIPLDSDVAERRGRYVSVNLEVLVKEIVLAPHATPWFAQVVKLGHARFVGQPARNTIIH